MNPSEIAFLKRIMREYYSTLRYPPDNWLNAIDSYWTMDKVVTLLNDISYVISFNRYNADITNWNYDYKPIGLLSLDSIEWYKKYKWISKVI
jgi:hypothetical protein